MVNPSGEGAVSITEDAVQPESANIRLIVPNLTDPAGGTPSSIRIISVTGGTLWQSGGGSITLGTSGTTLSLSAGKIDFRFRPEAGRDTNASFLYAVVDPHNSSINSSSSTATIPITAVNDAPVLQTLSGSTGIGLAATYYISSWDLTGSTSRRIDSTVNFSNNFGVSGLNTENFSVRWSGQVKAPVSGNFVFSTASDDGVRLWVDNNLIIDNWTLHGETTDTASAVALVADTMYDIRMEFYERGGGEVARLMWSYPGQSSQVIPQAYLFPAITRPTLSFVTGSSAVVIDDAVSISDVDSTTIASSTVAISTNFQSNQDSLLFTDQNGITGSYSSGTLTLTGTTSLANYQTALRSIRYANSTTSPSTSTRTIEFKVNDGQTESNSTYRDISFTATNSAPVITQGASVSVTMDEDSTPTAFSLTLEATDADYHSITWSVSGSASNGTASVSGTGDSKSISYTPTANYYGSDSFVVQASDGLGGVDTITVNVTIRDKTAPVISSVARGTLYSTSTSITWNTDEAASTKVAFGATSSYGTSTPEADTSPRVTSHSQTLGSLLPCTLYHYAVVSTDSNSNTSTSTDGTFTTVGCEGQTEAISATSTIFSSSVGGTSTLVSGLSGIAVSAPANFTGTSSSVVIQIKPINSSLVLSQTGRPSRANNEVGSIVFDVKAIINNSTILDSFDAPITITYEYADSEISTLNESSLWLYHYHNSAWEALDDCTVDLSANTVTCTTESFSIFGLFGNQLSTGSGSSGGNGTPVYGCRDIRAKNYHVLGHTDTAFCDYGSLAMQDSDLPKPKIASFTFSQDIKAGFVGRDAWELQKFLNSKGFMVALSGPGSLGNETERFGAGTRNALIKYQKARGITPANGLLGPLTRKIINSEIFFVSDPVKELASPLVSVTDVRDLTVGMTGDDVRWLQTLLINADTGTKAKELKRVTATGLFSIYTKNALSEYQLMHGISPSVGYFGIKTRAQMKQAGLGGLWW